MTSPIFMSPAEIESQFREAAERRGISIKRLCADGRLHRADATGRGGKGDAAYVLHLDGCPAGGFENWRDGLGWQPWRPDVRPIMTAEERLAWRAKIEKQQKEREAAKLREMERAEQRAAWIWEHSAPAAPDHPYLARKQIAPHGLREYCGALVVPMRTIDGKLRSLQFIGTDGVKRFLRGGMVQGCFCIIPGACGGTGALTEGFATGATIREATGMPVAAAFDAGNLLAVAHLLRSKYPAKPMVICADDDWKRVNRITGLPENIGVIKALEAANAINAVAAIPVFGDGRQEGDTDFNDLGTRRGLNEVREQIMRVLRIAMAEAA